MRNPSRHPSGSHVGRSATLAGYAIFAMALTIVVAVLLTDRRGVANTTSGLAAAPTDTLGFDELVGVLTGEPAMRPPPRK